MSEILTAGTVWGVLLTIAAYGLGAFISRKTGHPMCNPLLLGTIAVIIVLTVCGIPYTEYKRGASIVSWALLPATVSLAVPLYEKLDLLKKNLAAVLTGIITGVITSLAVILGLSVLFHLSKSQAVTLLPKSVTTAIGMDVSASLGGMPALTGAAIAVTGIAGNLSAEFVCRLLKITDPVAKGIGIGTASHAIGTSRAMEMGETEGAMSGLSIAAAGIITALLAPLAAGLLH